MDGGDMNFVDVPEGGLEFLQAARLDEHVEFPEDRSFKFLDQVDGTDAPCRRENLSPPWRQNNTSG